MRSQAEFSASESQGVSTRAWLYLGAVAIGFWLASMADFDASAGSAESSIASHGEAVASSDEAPNRVAPTTDGLNALRSVTLETTPRIGTRAQ